METHAQDLHKAPGKNFWHFFFEFFMLFLAVFCGLLAENWREHSVESKREKEYMQSMVEDLKSDTAEIQHQIVLGITEAAKADSLIYILNHDNPANQIQTIYRLNFGRVVKAQLEDRTSSQLKNAGGMRMIRNKKVADALREYWNVNKTMDFMNDRLEERTSAAQLIGSQIFSNKYFLFDNKYLPVGFKVDPEARFINDDPKLLSQFSNFRFQHNLILRNYINALQYAHAAAIDLMALIENEYHIK